MIVNPVPEGWEIIYQQAHAMLAAEIAFRWRRDLAPAFRYLETLAAIAQHDDGQSPWRGHDALTEAGAPADFSMKTDYDLEQARQVMYEARFQGRWRSFLTSRHMSFLYESMRGTDDEIDVFLDEQRAHQNEWRVALGVTEADAQSSYDFMQWCDRLSLILCRNELPQGERALEISTGPDGRRYDVVLRSNGNVVIAPWPFDADELSLEVESCILTQLRFTDDDELAECLHRAPIRMKSWTIVCETQNGIAG